jgi:hypothetical protein
MRTITERRKRKGGGQRDGERERHEMFCERGSGSTASYWV